MKACELIERLSQLPPNAEVMVMDGNNGAGVPRAINFGPCERVVTLGDADQTYDCEHLIGVKVQTIGFGAY